MPARDDQAVAGVGLHARPEQLPQLEHSSRRRQLPLLLVDVARTTPSATSAGWACFAYSAAISMFLGFFAWYRGLALGGVARVSQVQLAQPLRTVADPVVLFGQRLEPAVLIAAAAVLCYVAAAQRSRVSREPPQRDRRHDPH